MFSSAAMIRYACMTAINGAQFVQPDWTGLTIGAKPAARLAKAALRELVAVLREAYPTPQRGI